MRQTAGRVMPPKRVGSNELKPQKRALVLVAIFHSPALGMRFGDLDGGSLFYKILSLGREPAFEHPRVDCPEEPIGIRYNYLRKRFTFVLAKIQCCPAHY